MTPRLMSVTTDGLGYVYTITFLPGKEPARDIRVHDRTTHELVARLATKRRVSPIRGRFWYTVRELPTGESEVDVLVATW